MTLPLAIYTAKHGLAWQYDETAIPYAELDVCRTILGPIPDFEAGEVGYEGVAAVGSHVFVLRCFKAAKWDFLGRDSLYLAVTWVSRNEVEDIDLGALLQTQELNEPMREPLKSFELKMNAARSMSQWGAVGKRIAMLRPGLDIRFLRKLPNGSVQMLDEDRAVGECSVRNLDNVDQMTETDRSEWSECGVCAGKECSKVSKCIAVALILASVVALLGYVVYDYLKTNREITDVTGRGIPEGRTRGCGNIHSSTNATKESM